MSEAKKDPWVFAQRAQSSWALSRALQFSSVDLLNVIMFLSSKKPSVEVGSPPTDVRSSAAKSKNKISDRDDPCGMSFVVRIAALV